MIADPFSVAAGLPDATARSAKQLSYCPEMYFLSPDGTFALPIERLRLSRSRPDGIASAVKRMAEAAAGARARRLPVNVMLRSDGLFDVIDGNSTVVAAAAAGWTHLPCRLEPGA